MNELNPWRHASKMQLRNMVATATRAWERALKADDPIRAQQIQDRLKPVSEALDRMTN